MRRNIAILAVGDRKDYDSFRKFNKERRLFIKKGFEYASINYREALAGRIPQLPTEKVIIFLFFPFYYWDKYIEHRNYRGIYGSLNFYRKFGVFCERIEKIFKKALPDKELLFVNQPSRCASYRDKVAVKRKFQKGGISTPKLYSTRHIKAILNWLNRGNNFFIKPRCGSMGKGITYLSWSDWQTNFAFKNNKIISRVSDKGWRFKDITGNHTFLRKLLNKDIFIEKAIDIVTINNKKVDFRIYTFFNKTLYVYPRKNHPEEVTTNISQGGKGDPALLDILPKHLILKAKKIAEKASKVLGLNLAGVDVALDKNFKDVYVVDVNAFPGFPRRRTFNITRSMLKELIKIINREGLHFAKSRNI